jgi:AraC-like DNA-binding protein
MGILSGESLLPHRPLPRHNITIMRHGTLTRYDPRSGVSISTLAYEYPAEYSVPEHAHHSDQLIYATRGVMEISAGRNLWLTPPHLALWVPARMRHRILMPGPVSMRTLYLRRGLGPCAPKVCTVIHVSPLLRELILEAVSAGELLMRDHLHCALRDLMVFQLQNAMPVPMLVRLPEDSRALAVARACIRRQAGAPSLAVLCREAGVSVRTLERTFRREIGTTFEYWRRQVRLMKGIELLVEGHPVKAVASEVGYRQASAFVEVFRRTFGIAPKAWASTLQDRQALRNRTGEKLSTW